MMYKPETSVNDRTFVRKNGGDIAARVVRDLERAEAELVRVGGGRLRASRVDMADALEIGRGETKLRVLPDEIDGLIERLKALKEGEP